MESFTNQKPRIATEEECKASWGGYKNGAHFRCYLCGHKFIVGDQWRWVCGGTKTFISSLDGKTYGVSNLMVCKKCDDTNEEVLNKWQAAYEELNTRFWWAIGDQ